MPMRLRTPMPDITGATEWFHADHFDQASLKGKPVLVHFWSVSCHICHEVMDEVVSYREQFKDSNLQLIGIHMPKQESDTDVEKVKKDIEQYHIGHPVAVDNLHKVTEAFQNEFVPAFFLFDLEGNLYFRAAGDKGFSNLKPKIRQLLGISEE